MGTSTFILHHKFVSLSRFSPVNLNRFEVKMSEGFLLVQLLLTLNLRWVLRRLVIRGFKFFRRVIDR